MPTVYNVTRRIPYFSLGYTVFYSIIIKKTLTLRLAKIDTLNFTIIKTSTYTVFLYPLLAQMTIKQKKISDKSYSQNEFVFSTDNIL